MRFIDLCVTCHGPQFVAYLRNQPDVSLRRLGRWARCRFELEADPTPAALRGFLARCGIKRLTRAQWSEARRARFVATMTAAPVPRPRLPPPPPPPPADLVKPEHRAIAAASSIFSFAQLLGAPSSVTETEACS